MANDFAFLSDARNSLTLATLAPESDAARRRLSLDIEIIAGTAADPARVAKVADVIGPGDITAVSRAMISRVEPGAGLRAFEPNYMPFLEFIDADFPWRYTLDGGAANRVKPWIMLIALAADEYEVVTGASEHLPRIRVLNPSKSLPDLAQSWAFAHAHVALAAGNADPAANLAADATRSFSRLLCPRKLEERRAYGLFLVPAYEAGRLRGLGKEPKATPYDAPAWTVTSPDAIELPAYFQSRFVTDSLEDLEQLLRRLKPVSAAEAEAAGAPALASAANPGYFPGYTNPGASFEIQTALRQVGKPAHGLETAAALNTLMTETLKDSIKGETGMAQPGEADPLVAYPAYGWRYQQESQASRTKAEQNTWFDLVNLDLKFRQAAGLGAEAVRQNQEVYAQRCFEQYEEIVEANRRLARLGAAAVLAEQMTVKHFAKLPADIQLTLAEPLQPFVAASGKTSIIEAMRQAGAPTSYASRGLRRVAAKRSLKVKHAGAGEVRVAPQPAIPGDLTSNPILQDMQRRRGDKQLSELAGREGLSSPMREVTSKFLDGASFSKSVRPRQLGVRVEPFESAAFATRLTASLTKLPLAKAKATIGGLKAGELTTLAPVYRAPVVADPLADRVKEFAKEALLSGVSSIPTDRVALFEENRMFIEAFLVGANHEMNKELRWREFPTDMRGTIFKRFWNRNRGPTDPLGDDIGAIHGWTKVLGKNFPPGDADQKNNLVIVIRSSFVAKLDLPIVELNKASGTKWVSGAGVTSPSVFSGKITRDIAYYGFDVSREDVTGPDRLKYFLVIREPMGRLRFGIDVSNATVRQARRDRRLQSLAFPVRHFGRDETVVPTRAIAVSPAPAVPATWDDLSWSHMTLTPSAYVDFARNFTLAGQRDYWGATKTSASLALSFWQKPLAAVMPLRRVLP
jgi:hypothetical protein